MNGKEVKLLCRQDVGGLVLMCLRGVVRWHVALYEDCVLWMVLPTEASGVICCCFTITRGLVSDKKEENVLE